MSKEKKLKWIISCSLISYACILLVSSIYHRHSIEQHNEKKIVDFFNQPIQEQKEVIPIKQTNRREEPYIAVLEIPSIHVKRGLVSPNSSQNHVRYNIQIINPSSMPNVQKGILILAGHNGNSAVSFFRNLSKLTVGDFIYVYYQGYQYIYQFDNLYEIEKNGQAEMIRDVNRTTIALITCKNHSKTKQEVYIGYLIDVQKYD